VTQFTLLFDQNIFHTANICMFFGVRVVAVMSANNLTYEREFRQQQQQQQQDQVCVVCYLIFYV
jgi:hypothetical protein